MLHPRVINPSFHSYFGGAAFVAGLRFNPECHDYSCRLLTECNIYVTPSSNARKLFTVCKRTIPVGLGKRSIGSRALLRGLTHSSQ